VPKEKIAANGDYNLSGERYREGSGALTTFTFRPIGDIAEEIKAGFASGQSSVDTKGVPHIRPMNITDKGQFTWDGLKQISASEYEGREGYALRSGDVLFNNTNSKELVGKTCLIESDIHGGFSNHMTRIRVKPGVCVPNFLALLLHNAWQKGIFLELANRWVGQAGINATALAQFQIPLPPLEGQKEIVAEIEGYQKVINGARAVLDHYRPHIPIHPDWPMVELGEACDVRDGTHDTPKYVLEGYPLITSKNLKSGFIDFTEVNLITREDLDAINKRSKVDAGDLLMPMIGTIGNPVVADDSREYAVKNVALIKFPKGCLVDNRFLKDVLDSAAMQDRFQRQASGSTQKFIPLGFIRKLEIPLPPLATQQAIVAEIEAEQALVAANRELITRFEQKIQATLARIWGSTSDS